jgi:type IV pilus assembly protein PilA
MFKALKKRLKNQRGLTLIELLAVVVILGIIAAIAVPSIGGLIDNTKKDAHVANAQVMVNAAKLAITTDANLQKSNDTTPVVSFLTLGYLEGQNFVETIEDPDGGNYANGGAVILTVAATETSAVSYVKVVNGKVTSVKLVNANRGVQDASKSGITPANLKRGVVIKNPS